MLNSPCCTNCLMSNMGWCLRNRDIEISIVIGVNVHASVTRGEEVGLDSGQVTTHQGYINGLETRYQITIVVVHLYRDVYHRLRSIDEDVVETKFGLVVLQCLHL